MILVPTVDFFLPLWAGFSYPKSINSYLEGLYANVVVPVLFRRRRMNSYPYPTPNVSLCGNCKIFISNNGSVRLDWVHSSIGD